MGPKVRALRQKSGLTQAALAERLEVSASYLNLIEHDRRALPSALLIRLAQILDLDLKAIGVGEDSKVVGDLMEVFADPLFEEAKPSEDAVREIAAASPGISRAVVQLHHAYTTAHASAQTLAAEVLDRQDLPGMGRAGLSSEQVTDFIQSQRNHFPALESEAERVWKDGQLEGEDLFGALCRHLEARHKVTVQVEELGEMSRALRR